MDITMSIKETRQISTFEKLQKKEITQKMAGKLLSMSIRQIRRKQGRFQKVGVRGLIHKNRGCSGNRKIPKEIHRNIVELYNEKYGDFGPTLAAEKLKELHGIQINRETLRRILTKVGLWRVKKMKQKHRQWRDRKKHEGELIQLDGSHHAWFELRGVKCCMIGLIDDATGKIYIELHTNESHQSVMKTVKNFCLQFGLPLAFYPDRGGVYKVNLNNQDNERKTQFERALKELGIKITHARSPQAKGRIERLFGTLQDRLVKEFRLRNISTIEAANEFLQKEYMEIFNAKFAKEPAEQAHVFREVSEAQLQKAFCLKDVRKLQNDFTLRYKNRILQLDKQQKTIVRPKNTIEIMEHFNGTIDLHIRKVKLFFNEITRQYLMDQKREQLSERWSRTRPIVIPAKDHPWRKTNHLFFKERSISNVR